MRRSRILALVLTLCAVPAGVGAVPVVFCEPETITVDSAEVFQVGVRVDQLDTLSNYQIIFTYDTTVLEFITAYEGSLYVNSGLQTWFTVEEESLGTWEVFDVIFPALTYLLPPGELCRLEFRALRTGLSPIEFLSVALTDRYREGIDPLTWRDGLVLVGDWAGVEDGAPRFPSGIGFPEPNPTYGNVKIPLNPYGEAGDCPISASVFDTRGRLIAGLSGPVGADAAYLVWDGRDAGCRAVPPGIYFVRIAGPVHIETRKVVVIR